MNQEAFWKKQYEQNIARMVGVCYRYVDDLPLAEDLAHDAFLKAIEKSDTYRATGKFDNWLMRIAVNEALMYLRKCPEMVEADETLVQEEEIDEESSLAALDFTQEELLATIHQLPLRQRTVFNLYALEHYPHAKIAESMGISVSNSKVLLSRARQQLQQMLLAKAEEKKSHRKEFFMLLLLLFKGRTKAKTLDSRYENGLSDLKCTPSAKLSEDEIKAAVAASPGGAGIAIAAHKTAIGVGAVACLAGIACLSYLALHEPAQNTTPELSSPGPVPSEAVATDSVSGETAENSFIPVAATNAPSVANSRAEEKSNVVIPAAPAVEDTSLETENVVVKKVVLVKKTIIMKENVTLHDTIWIP